MRFLRLLNILSIDVALGAAGLAMVIANIWNIDLPYTVPILLAMIVWIIYTFDHIKDAHETKVPGLSPRRDFHRKYFKPLVIISIALLLSSCFLLFMIPERLLLFGSVLSCLVIAYYFSLHFLKSGVVNKEFIIAILYTGGIVIGPLACGTPPSGYMVHIFQLFLLALNNLLLFSWFDHETDVQEGFAGLIQRMGHENSRWMLLALGLIQIVLALVLFATGFYPGFEFIWFCMASAMIVPVLQPGFWSAQSRYRILGDALFFLPVLILFS